MAKFYAVKVGREVGVFRTWEKCKEQVLGYPSAVYKSFLSEEEANRFLKGTEELKEVEKELECSHLVAYVDGSFTEGDFFGSGCVLLYEDKIIDKISKKYIDEELAKMRNVAGEIKAAEIAMQYAIDNGFKKIVIYHDYEGISKWCLGEWKTNKIGTIAYKKFYEEAIKQIEVQFIKVKGHSGDYYNELADELAKKAIYT